MIVELRKRVTNAVLFAYEVANESQHPVRTALLAAVRAGRDPDLLKAERDELRALDDLTPDELQLKGETLAVIERELASPLRDANLSGADLSDANLRGAYLSGALNVPAGIDVTPPTAEQIVQADTRRVERMAEFRTRHPSVPVVENLDAKILALVEKDPSALDMSNWHSCETTHCRAGWAVHLAGEAGYAIEKRTDPEHAGRLIYLASTGRVPDFFADNEAALEDLRACADGSAKSEVRP